MRGGKRTAPSSRLSFLPLDCHIYERMARVNKKKPSEKRFRSLPKKKREKDCGIVMTQEHAVYLTSKLKRLWKELPCKGLIHWNREMGMKKLKEMFPDVYEEEKARLHCRAV